MVTAVETREKVEIQRITLEELGEMIGVPIKVRPWWGSVRRWHVSSQIEVDRKSHLVWECPGQARKRPEVRNGIIILWEGQCKFRLPYRTRYGEQHTHAQTIEVESVAQQAMLVTIWVSEGTKGHFLLGVDGGSPYVVQVTRRPQTVEEVFDWLMPNVVRKAIEQGLNVKRQGDWYFIPRDKPPALYPNDGEYYHGNVYGASPSLKTNLLYRGAPLVFNNTQTRHHGGLVVYQSILGSNGPVPIVRGNIKAPDHETLHLRGWHIGVRNRSHPWRNSDQRRRADD